MPTEEPTTTQFYDLVAYEPGSDSTEPREWLHHECEGNLQIGNDATIRCQKCDYQQPAINWSIGDENHLVEVADGSPKLDFPTLASLAGQIASTAGAKWLSEFLSNVEE